MTPRFPKKPLLLGAILLMGAAGTYLSIHSAKDPAHAQAASDARTSSEREAQPQDAEVDALLAELHALSSGSSEALDFQALQQTLQSLVKKNPQAAADFASSLTDASLREISLHRVAQAWAARHPEAAARWANAIRNQEERGALLNGIFCEVAQNDPAKAVQMAETYDLLSFSPGMSGNLVQQWAARDYETALRWVKAQAAGASRDEMIQRLALVRSATAPEEAARMISEQIASRSIQEEAAISIVSRWAATDAEAAAEWANSFEAAEFRERALNEINIALATAQTSAAAATGVKD